MKVWLFCVVVFFGIAELFPSVHWVAVPSPVFWIAGLLLAIASNADKRAGLPWLSSHSSQPQPMPPTDSTSVAPSPDSLPQPQATSIPPFRPPASERSISFTIPKPTPQNTAPEPRSTR